MTNGSSVRTLLSINFNHDGAGVLLTDGQIGGYVCAERHSSLKKHPGIREDDLDDLLDQAGLTLENVDHVLLCNLHNMDSPDIPALHGSDLKETWLEFWVNQRNDTVRIRGRTIPCTVNPDHHLLHVSAPYFTSPFDTAVCLAIDPLGCRAFIGKEQRLYPLDRGYDAWFNANIGYTHVAAELFGSGVVGAGKVMGLAPYGRTPRADDIHWQEVSDFATLVKIASVDPVMVNVDGRDLNATLAYLIQRGLERQLAAVLDDLAAVCQRNRVSLNLCLSGGTALNAVANQACFIDSEFEQLHLHPACGDDGTAIGAALWYWHHVLDNPRRQYQASELMYSIRTYADSEIVRAAESAANGAPGELIVRRTDNHSRVAAELLAEGATVGWFDGASEVGPRALGHRSILADPRSPRMRDHLNRRVKHREHFRPFAPAVLNEHAASWFGLADSPFMLRACPVLKPGLPAITHVDGTSRIQTVTRADNRAFYELIECFRTLTGVPLILNTSLNTKGLPIDETPDDALRTLISTRLDYLVFPGVVVGKAAAACEAR